MKQKNCMQMKYFLSEIYLKVMNGIEFPAEIDYCLERYF